MYTIFGKISRFFYSIERFGRGKCFIRNVRLAYRFSPDSVSAALAGLTARSRSKMSSYSGSPML